MTETKKGGESVYVNLATGKGHLVRHGQAACGTSLGSCAESQHAYVSCKRCIRAEMSQYRKEAS